MAFRWLRNVVCSLLGRPIPFPGLGVNSQKVICLLARLAPVKQHWRELLLETLVDVLKPNEVEKLQILESLVSKVQKASHVNSQIIATNDFSGADIVDMVNDAAREAVRVGAKVVTSQHLLSARDEIRKEKGYLSQLQRGDMT
ncbi:cell division protease ftsH-like protein mitochondrial [Trifolium pratense]|uniref:Cell division protease ftsH-like protein mitochondrial n=1 Tax=Trifolium pratense TaxID=57577 RepID=A0A2K3LR68_TRIPR|nr:cell division protease ftsH-like protein mitochondrial [Trifolium pratense]